MNILIVKLSAIGDVIHTLPALNALRRQYPYAHITWLAEEAAYPLINNHRALNRVLVSKRKRWVKTIFGLKTSLSERIGAFGEASAFIRELRDTRYDVILDFQALLKGAALIALCRGTRKIGYGKGMEHDEHSYLVLNERVEAISMENHAIVRNMNMLKPLGADTGRIEYHLPISVSDRRAADEFISQNKTHPHQPLIAINPIAKWETKLWDNRKFAETADAVIERFQAAVVFTGGHEDVSDIGCIRSAMKGRAVSLAGKTTLTQLAALYERSDAVISTDTGPMHLAAAAGAPVIAIFGPTAPWRTGPYGTGHQVIRSELSCSPCFKRQCPTTECMRQISADRVLKAVDSLLSITSND